MYNRLSKFHWNVNFEQNIAYFMNLFEGSYCHEHTSVRYIVHKTCPYRLFHIPSPYNQKQCNYHQTTECNTSYNGKSEVAI